MKGSNISTDLVFMENLIEISNVKDKFGKF